MPGHSFRKRARQHERDWFKVLFRLRGSVIPAVLPRVIICSAFALLIAVLHVTGWRVSLPVLGGWCPVLCWVLLLVFRNADTPMSRFWEGRILWRHGW